MADYIVSCESAADLSPEWMEKRDLKYICFTFSLNGTEYKDDLWASMEPDELYRRMLAGEEAKTSQVGLSEYLDHFREYLKEGKDLLHCTLSTGISGTYNAAVLAARQLRDEFPDRKIYVIDSLAASSGYGLLMDKIADMRDSGMGVEELAAWTEAHKLNAVHWFFSTDLTFYIRGGRVSKTAGFVGQVLSICPLLNVDYKGRLIPREKVRTKKKVLKRQLEKMIELADNGLDYNDTCFISHSNDPVAGEEMRTLVEETFPNLKGKVQLFPIGATVGAHTGPGTIALFFWGKKRED